MIALRLFGMKPGVYGYLIVVSYLVCWLIHRLLLVYDCVFDSWICCGG